MKLDISIIVNIMAKLNVNVKTSLKDTDHRRSKDSNIS